MTTPDISRRASMPTWSIATIAGIFGLFYAYVVWSAVGLLIVRANDVLGLNGLGWGVMLFAVAFPILVFAGAFALGWKRSAWQFALILFAGLCLAAVFWLDIIAYTSTNASIYGG